MGGGVILSRKKVKSAGKIPQDFTAGIKVFLQRGIANFQAKNFR